MFEAQSIKDSKMPVGSVELAELQTDRINKEINLGFASNYDSQKNETSNNESFPDIKIVGLGLLSGLLAQYQFRRASSVPLMIGAGFGASLGCVLTSSALYVNNKIESAIQGKDDTSSFSDFSNSFSNIFLSSMIGASAGVLALRTKINGLPILPRYEPIQIKADLQNSLSHQFPKILPRANISQKPSLNDISIPELAHSVARLETVGSKEPTGGSAFVVREDGLLATNRHVVDAGHDKLLLKITPHEGKSNNLRELYAAFPDGRRFRTEVVAFHPDPKVDLALLRIVDNTGSKFKALKLGDSSALVEGERVFNIGYPGSIPELSLAPLMSRFNISAKRNTEVSPFDSVVLSLSQGRLITPASVKERVTALGHETYIYSRQAMAGGQSGSPIFDQRGNVISIATYRFGVSRAGSTRVEYLKSMLEKQ